MTRLTIDKPVREMSMTELALNCCYGYDGWVRYRDYEDDIDIRDLARKLWLGHKTHDDLPEDDEALGEFLHDWTAYDPAVFDEALIALTYRLMWAMAELRARLKEYEDTGLTPEEIKNSLTDATDLAKVAMALRKLRNYEDAEADGRLIVLPCKVGDTVWFIGGNKGIVPERPFVIHEGKVTKIRSVTFSDGTIVFIVDIYYEFPDPFYNDGRMRGHEAICSFTKWGSWPRFYLTREEAEAALGEAGHADP